MDDHLVPGLVLDRVAYGERDLILTLLTRGHGLVSAMARSARGSRRRFGGGLDLFVVYQARLRLRPPPRLSALVGADPIRQFPGILEDLARLEAGQAMLAAARDLLKDAPAPARVFDLAVAHLQRLEQVPPESAHLPLLDLCLGILAEVGHVPAGTRCPACGRPLDQGGVLLDGGSIVCAKCGCDFGGPDVPPAMFGRDPPRRAEAIAFLTRLMTAALGRPYRIPLRPE